MERDSYRPTSQLAKAMHYSLNRRETLSRFLDDSRIELDTSLLERSLRGPAVGMRHFLFFGSFHGGRSAATLYSIVQIARLYQLDVTAYLNDILRCVAALSRSKTTAQRELLPHGWASAHSQHILQARQQETHEALEQRRPRRASVVQNDAVPLTHKLCHPERRCASTPCYPYVLSLTRLPLTQLPLARRASEGQRQSAMAHSFANSR